MFVRHDYGQALFDSLNGSVPGLCTVTTYENSGHGVMYDYPAEIRIAILAALD